MKQLIDIINEKLRISSKSAKMNDNEYKGVHFNYGKFTQKDFDKYMPGITIDELREYAEKIIDARENDLKNFTFSLFLNQHDKKCGWEIFDDSVTDIEWGAAFAFIVLNELYENNYVWTVELGSNWHMYNPKRKKELKTIVKKINNAVYRNTYKKQ